MALRDLSALSSAVLLSLPLFCSRCFDIARLKDVASALRRSITDQERDSRRSARCASSGKEAHEKEMKLENKGYRQISSIQSYTSSRLRSSSLNEELSNPLVNPSDIDGISKSSSGEMSPNSYETTRESLNTE